MPIEHFLYALFPDGKLGLIKTSGVNKILTDKSMEFLRKKTCNGEPYWLPTEQVVAIQHIEQATDKDGREGVWNHTLLIPIGEYIRLTDPCKLFSKYFIPKISVFDKSPESLEPIKTGE